MSYGETKLHSTRLQRVKFYRRLHDYFSEMIRTLYSESSKSIRLKLMNMLVYNTFQAALWHNFERRIDF
jgi:hypothetical protein